VDIRSVWQGGIGCDSSLTLDDFIASSRRDGNVFGQPILCGAHRYEELFLQNLPWCDVRQQFAFHI